VKVVGKVKFVGQGVRKCNGAWGGWVANNGIGGDRGRRNAKVWGLAYLRKILPVPIETGRWRVFGGGGNIGEKKQNVDRGRGNLCSWVLMGGMGVKRT